MGCFCARPSLDDPSIVAQLPVLQYGYQRSYVGSFISVPGTLYTDGERLKYTGPCSCLLSSFALADIQSVDVVDGPMVIRQSIINGPCLKIILMDQRGVETVMGAFAIEYGDFPQTLWKLKESAVPKPYYY